MQSFGSYAIRFNAASMQDEDEGDELVDMQSKPKKEVLQFERCSSTSPLVLEDESVPAATDVQQDTVNGQQPVPNHPGLLWKSSSQPRSAPVSVPTSPHTPSSSGSGTPVTITEKGLVKATTAANKDEPEKASIFSSLREKFGNLSAESKDLFDRKMKKPGTGDVTKAQQLVVESILKSDGGESEKTRSRNCSGELMKDTTDHAPVLMEKASSIDVMEDSYNESTVQHKNVPATFRKSTSALQIAKRNTIATDIDIKAGLKSASMLEDCVTSVALSGLISTSSSMNSLHQQSENRDDTLQFFDVRDDGLSCANKMHHDSPQLTSPINKVQPRLYSRYIAILRRRNLLAYFVGLLAYVVIPLPSYLSGLIAGIVLTSATVYMYDWWTRPATPKAIPQLPDFKTLPPLQVPEMKESKNMEGKFKVNSIE